MRDSKFATAYITEDLSSYDKGLVEILNGLMVEIKAPVEFSYNEKYIYNQYDMSRAGMPVGKILARDFELVAKRLNDGTES